MPTLLVTGATGFIGAETVAQALAKGYHVRAAVRRAEQIPVVRARYPDAADAALSFAVVPALDDQAGWAAALVGVDAVLHIASPMVNAAADNADGLDLQTGYVDPAVRGTLALLEAARQTPGVRRVVVTSSYFALAPLDVASRPGYVVAEGANAAVAAAVAADLQTVAAALPPPPAREAAKYQLSKVLAHRATLDWVARETPAFSVVTVHPFYVIGHDRTQTAARGPGGLNKFFLLSLRLGQPIVPSGFVDVRDVGAAELAAVEQDAATLAPAGQVTELLVKGPRMTWGEIAAFVRDAYPAFPLQLATDGAGGAAAEPPTADTTRLASFGVRVHPALDTVKTVMEQNRE